MYYHDSRVQASQVIDGLSNTVAFTERIRNATHRGSVWAGGTHPKRLLAEMNDNGFKPTRELLTGVHNTHSQWQSINGIGNGDEQLGPSSSHLGGVFVVMGDGAVRFINDTIDQSHYPTGVVYLLFSKADEQVFVETDF